MAESDIIQQFRDFMAARGCAPAPGLVILADDQDHRYRIEGETKFNAVYQLKIHDGYGIGRIYNFKTGESWGFPEKGTRFKQMTAEERAAARTRIEQEQAARATADRRAEDATQARARDIWARCSETPRSGVPAYVTRKGIEPMAARYWGSVCVVPVYCEGAIWSLQFIGEDGSKRFLRGGRIKGGYAPLASAEDDKDTILICEGWASGCSLRMATLFPVVVAFTAGNLEAVAMAMRGKYPTARLIICADNDAFTFDAKKRPKNLNTDEIPADDPRWGEWRLRGILVNTGLEKARSAALKSGAHVIWPEFNNDTN